MAKRLYCRFIVAAAFGIFLVQNLPADNKPSVPAEKPAAKPAANPFAEIIRKTDPQTAQEEQKSFHLPPGFKIELVASEPDIGKPINMAFDAQGRLWITQSREYPFPATNKPPRDAIKILSDFNTNGLARKITTFASGLNIPIGLYPYKSGAIAYSIPSIYLFEDRDHDDHADKKEPFLGTFGFNKDTHGMTSSFRRGYDGWLYANHGFNNESTLTAKDGSSIKMHSGNTYRVKIDGSHIEQYAWGRVNPFGLIFDSLGDLFSSDCETLPIYQILRGGYYPSFGKPDDGLGFAPKMMDHKHGSTAIAGIVFYSATNFPPDFRENIFVGNVMTCRIDRDSLEVHGSTRMAKEQPDFLSTTDPWFRPVDIQQGPDGAIYVADFYNRIIGHYEVPLDNPGRDRERGRIWRISYVGTNGPAKFVSPEALNLAHASTSELIKQLGNSNLATRMSAMNELSDRIGASAIKPLKKMLQSKNSNVFQKIHGMWVLYRLDALTPELLTAQVQSPDDRLRIHALRVLSETPLWTEKERQLVIAALHDSDALAQRTAADALGHYPRFDNIRPLLDAREHVPAEDTHLLYVLRMALRNQLLDKGNFARIPLQTWSDADEKAITDVCMGVPASASARFLMHHMEKYPESRADCARYLRHVARYLPETDTKNLIEFINRQFSDDLDFQLALYKSVTEGIAERGGKPGESLREWGTDIARRLAVALQADSHNSWNNAHVEGLPHSANPWTTQERASADGSNSNRFLSSLPNEALTGILTSKEFIAPDTFSFFMAGHNGHHDKPDQKKNLVRLRASGSHKILMESYPPRHDVAREYTWDLSKFSGQKVYFEIVDADNAGAYAWLAVGRFKPDLITVPASDPRSVTDRQLAVANLVRTYKLSELEPALESWVGGRRFEVGVREAAAQALVTISPETHIALLSHIASNPAESPAIREKMAQVLSTINSDEARLALVDSLRLAPDQVQVKMALALAGSKTGSEMLLQLAEEGKISPRLLMSRSLTERMLAEKPDRYDERFAKLTKNLPPADEQLQKVLDKRRSEFDLAKADVEAGAKTFAQNCMVCHSMDNKGGAVGPHLDGVGNRGLERLVEDVLDPSRNVDPSFRYSTVTLKNGDVFAGLQRREEGAVVVFVDATGKEIPVAKSDISIRVESTASLMPDNFSEAIPQADFNNLMAYLLSKGSSQSVKK